MELWEYLRVARRRWLSVSAWVVLAIGGAILLTAQTTPQYESRAQLFISTSSTDSTEAYQGSLFSTQRVTSYAETVTNDQVARRVVDALELDITPEQLSGKVSASVRPDTVILDITVIDPDPREAQRLTQAYTVEMQGVVAEYETPPGGRRPALQAQISDPATLPDSPISPQPVRNLTLGLALGLLLGVGQAILREMLDNSVKTDADVTGATGAPVMAGIAYDPQVSKNPLISGLPSHQTRAEAFRVLRTNLQFVDVDHPDKAFVVTSSLSSEGKSTTAVNTAIAVAQTGHRVLLIDGDLRRPKVGRMLGLDGDVGLTTVLLGSVLPEEALQGYEDSTLDVLTSGAIPPNPAELLQSHAMHELLKSLRGKYHVVVIDAPPLLPVTDAALIASQVDGALMVVRHGKTTRDQLSGSVERLSAVGARPIGVVMNMIPKRAGTYGYGQYAYGYR